MDTKRYSKFNILEGYQAESYVKQALALLDHIEKTWG
jgi:hypothetical protein